MVLVILEVQPLLQSHEQATVTWSNTSKRTTSSLHNLQAFATWLVLSLSRKVNDSESDMENAKIGDTFQKFRRSLHSVASVSFRISELNPKNTGGSYTTWLVPTIPQNTRSKQIPITGRRRTTEKVTIPTIQFPHHHSHQSLNTFLL